MEEESDPYVILLHIVEGTGFEKIDERIIITGTLGGNTLETDAVDSSASTVFNNNLVWETDKNSIKRMKTENLPVKIEVFTTAIRQGQEVRKSIGYVLLPIRGVPMVTTKRTIVVKPHWYKLVGLNAEWRQKKPELSLFLTITEKGNLMRGGILQSEPVVNSLKEEFDPIDPEAVAKMLESQKGIFIKLLAEEGLLQVGNEETECDIFIVKLTFLNAKHLEQMVNNEEGSAIKFKFVYNLLGTITQATLSAKSDSVYPIQDKIAIHFRTSLETLDYYFKNIMYIPIEVFFEDAIVGNTKFSFAELIPTTNLQYFLEQFGPNKNIFEKGGSFLINTILDLPPNLPKPHFDYVFSIKYLSTTKVSNREVVVERPLKAEYNDKEKQKMDNIMEKSFDLNKGEEEEEQEEIIEEEEEEGEEELEEKQVQFNTEGKWKSIQDEFLIDISKNEMEDYDDVYHQRRINNRENNFERSNRENDIRQNNCRQNNNGLNNNGQNNNGQNNNRQNNSRQNNIRENDIRYNNIKENHIRENNIRESSRIEKFNDSRDYCFRNNTEPMSAHYSDRVNIESLLTGRGNTILKNIKNIPRTFSFTLVLKTVKFVRRPDVGIWQISLHHPKADTPFTLTNIELTEIQSNTIDFENLELQLFFASTVDEILDLIESESCTVQINGPRALCANAELDNRSLILATKEKKSGAILLENSAGEKLAIGSVSIYLNDLGLNFNSHIKKSPILMNKESSQPFSYLDRNLAYKIVEELEEWKHKQQEEFLVELKRLEINHLAKLSAEWQKRKLEQESELTEKLDQCSKLAAALEKAYGTVQKKGVIQLEQEQAMERMKSELEQEYSVKLLELRESSRRFEDDMVHQLKLSELKYNELETIKITIEKENTSLKAEIEKLKAEMHEIQKTCLPREQLAGLFQDVRLLNERLQEAQKSKLFYKEQWAKIIREVHKMKSENLQQMESHIKRYKNVGIKEVIDDENRHLCSEKVELNAIKELIDSDEESIVSDKEWL